MDVHSQANPDTDSLGKPDSDSKNVLSLTPLKSVQSYRTRDEFLVAMREDLADWFNNLYGLNMDEQSLFDQLANGVLLCKHANAFNDAALTTDFGSSKSKRLSSGSIPGLSTASGVTSATTSGQSNAVVYRENAALKSFQSRVNISNFLAWCRSTIGLRDTLLFETEDLIQGRNERNVVLCLLEVARRGARIGMLAPSLVQLEAEIDAEIARDEAAAAAAAAETDSKHFQGPKDVDLHGDTESELTNVEQCLKSEENHSEESSRTRDVGIQATEDVRVSSPVISSSFRSSSESVCSSTGSSSKQHHHPHHHPSTASAHPSAAASTSRPPRRPVIEVDMMSLDEMVRKILNRCTCEFQYPMIRVSEGKYKIGDSLTLIFVRILRNHVMVRIGGGWDTLENYLNRHDPCRVEMTRVTKIGSGQLRNCGQHLGDQKASEEELNKEKCSEGSGSSIDREDGVHSNNAFDSRDLVERNLAERLDGSATCENQVVLRNKVDDLSVQLNGTNTIQTPDDASVISDCVTRVTPSGKVVSDVACQTDDTTRRYSSSSGASSQEPTNRDERFDLGNYKTVDVTRGKTLDCNETITKTMHSTDMVVNAPCALTNVTEDCSKNEPSVDKPKQLGANKCQRCRQCEILGAGLCRTCSDLCNMTPSVFGQDKQHRAQRPTSAFVQRRHSLKTTTTTINQVQNTINSALKENQQKDYSSALMLDKQHRAVRPASAQDRQRRNKYSGLKQDHTQHTPIQTPLIEDNRKQVRGQRPASAQEKQQRNRYSALTKDQAQRNPIETLVEDQQPRILSRRPASAQTHSRTEKESQSGRALRSSYTPFQKGREPQLPKSSSSASVDKMNLKKTKSQDDLEQKSGTSVRRNSSLRNMPLNTASNKKIARELFKKKDDLELSNNGSSHEIAEMVEDRDEGSSGLGSKVQMTPRKDVQRTGSITKIPKPVVVANRMS